MTRTYAAIAAIVVAVLLGIAAYFAFAPGPQDKFAQCRLDNARNAEAVTLLDERGYDVTPIFISIDPDRDTPEVMAEFTDYMHPRMIGLTGTPEQVKAASTAYRTYFKKQDSDDPDYYLVDHSTFTYLVLPGEGFVEFFRREDTPEEMAERVACFVDAAGK